jgi:BMFP domain-containing protein YqiC
MLEPKLIDDLSRRLANHLPSGLRAFRQDLDAQLRHALERALSRLDLVTREEFDVQQAVLLRTREKLETLERRLIEIETEAARRPAGSVHSAD